MTLVLISCDKDDKENEAGIQYPITLNFSKAEETIDFYKDGVKKTLSVKN